jgi:hypothetical protein
MSDRALQQKDAKVNKSLDFVSDKTPLVCLFDGHKPSSVMVDTRDELLFDKIVANKDRSTLKIEVFETFPVLER